jgi:hypothetical protein
VPNVTFVRSVNIRSRITPAGMLPGRSKGSTLARLVGRFHPRASYSCGI